MRRSIPNPSPGAPARRTGRTASARRPARRILGLVAAALLGAALVGGAPAQTLPVGAGEEPPFVCPPRDEPLPPPVDEAERLERERRARYRVVFPAFLELAPPEPDDALVMPVDGVRVTQVADTWGAARSEGRSHEGTDIFAPRGTTIRSATPGWVYRIGPSRRGGRTVTVIGGAGRRYYYAHLESYHPDLREGQRVEIGTPLGTVGDSGNAAGTPPHLHLGVYESRDDVCSWDALNPFPLLADRN